MEIEELIERLQQCNPKAKAVVDNTSLFVDGSYMVGDVIQEYDESVVYITADYDCMYGES